MTERDKVMKEGRDCFYTLEAYYMQDPCILNPYNDDKKSERYRYWMEGWLDVAANYWESLGSD